MLQIFTNNVCQLRKFCPKIKQHNLIKRFVKYAISDKWTEWDKIKSKYSESNLKSVLNVLNSSKKEDIEKYRISKENIDFFINCRKNGYIQCLDEYLSSDQMNAPILEEICDVILHTTDNSSTISEKCSSQPDSSIVALKITQDALSWSAVELNDSDCRICNWNFSNIPEIPINANLVEVVDVVTNVVKLVPDSDIYVIEKETPKFAASKINATILRYIIRSQQINAMVFSLLRNSKDAEGKHKRRNFHLMKNCASTSYFKLQLGQETVSANDTIDRILKNTSTNLKNIKNVSCDSSIISTYKKTHFKEQNAMNLSLLIALTYLEKLKENKLKQITML